MRFFGQLIGFVSLLLLLLPLTAQEEKKDAPKAAEKKDAEPEKKDPEKTEPEKKSAAPEKKKEPVEEKFVYGFKYGPVKLLKAESGEFTIEVQVPDPMKIYQVEVWSAQQMLTIQRQTNPAQAAQQMAQYQMQLAQKETTSPKPLDVKAADSMKVRANVLPVQYDDQGNLKKWTAKQLAALRGKSKWPGAYPAEADVLKVGQIVDVYISKASMPAPPPRTGRPKKKSDLEAEAALSAPKPEAVLIVVLQEPWAK